MGRAATGWRSSGGSPSPRLAEGRRPGEGPPARAGRRAARGRRSRPGGPGRARARLPGPERARGGSARARGGHPGVRPGRGCRLRDHGRRPGRRARRARDRAPPPGVRRLHARGSRPAGVAGAGAGRPERPARGDGLPAARAAAARRARRGRRARGRDGLRRGRAAARSRRRDRRPRLEREHAADERPPLARLALLVAGGARRRRGAGRRLASARANPAQRRAGPRGALPDAERPRGRARRDLRARAGLGRAERDPARAAGHGGRARARPGGGRLAPPAAPRGGGRLVHPRRPRGTDARVTEVAAILADVRERGDAAVADWSLRLDGAEPRRAEPRGDLPEEALLALADAVRRWHQRQRPADLCEEILPGVVLERRWSPLASVGIYVPRRLVSTLVMCAVPAQVAGVERIAVATPPDGAGLVARVAELLGLNEVWEVGGPQAVAALAYGTETIAAVDKIVGPGNAFVNEAKLLVSRDVAVRLPAGPSEVVVLASA